MHNCLNPNKYPMSFTETSAPSLNSLNKDKDMADEQDKDKGKMDVGGAEKGDKKPVEAGAVEKLEQVRTTKPTPCAPGKSNKTSLEVVWIFNMELAADSLAAIDGAVAEEDLLLARRGEGASVESADDEEEELRGEESDSD